MATLGLRPSRRQQESGFAPLCYQNR